MQDTEWQKRKRVDLSFLGRNIALISRSQSQFLKKLSQCISVSLGDSSTVVEQSQKCLFWLKIFFQILAAGKDCIWTFFICPSGKVSWADSSQLKRWLLKRWRNSRGGSRALNLHRYFCSGYLVTVKLLQIILLQIQLCSNTKHLKKSNNTTNISYENIVNKMRS